MIYTPVALIPGPVRVPAFVREVLARDMSGGQREEDFIPLYHATSTLLATCMETEHDVVIMTGEGMLALWAGLKSCLACGDRVLSIANGVFGDGIGDMAAGLGCEVRKITAPFNSTVGDLTEIERVIAEFKPHMITAVHCETPSGTLNPLDGIGALKQKYNVPLFYVDAVSSIGGAPVRMDAWGIDILLGGSQKCLSAPPNLSFIGVSPAAWERAAQVAYAGYDALLPWKDIRRTGLAPYTPYWSGVAALHSAVSALFDEGLEAVFARHKEVASFCRQGLVDMGCALWAAPGAVASPTVTAAFAPKNFTAASWQDALRQRGVIVGASFGPMAEKVFRIGHMGSQAHIPLVKQAFDIMKTCL